MGEGDDQAPAEKVGEVLEEGGLAEPVVVRERGRWHKVRRITRRGLLAILVLAVVALAVLWTQRRGIADRTIAAELEKRGVQGSYTLDRVGLRTQEISNLVIGDPNNPDLTADKAIVQLRVNLDGSVKVFRIAARGVRLNARLVGGKVSFGQIDKLLPPPSGKPFTLPDVSVDIADTTVRLDTPFGRLGFALIGRGNLSGGFKGRLAASGPALRPGRCTLEGLRANVAISVAARRPHVVGPVSAKAFDCAASDIHLATARMEIDSRFSEGFDRLDGNGRLSFARFDAGANGLANATSLLTFKGTPTRLEGHIDLAAQAARIAAIGAERTRLDGHYMVDAARGLLDLGGDVSSVGVTLPPAMTSGLTGPLASLKGTPLDGIGRGLAEAVRRAAARLDVTGRIAVVNRPGMGGVRFTEGRTQSPSGATVAIRGGDGITYYWPTGRLRVDTSIDARGGGLPTAHIALSQPTSDAPLTGVADIAPYAANGARLALAPVRFGPAGNATRVTTVALLDGAFPGGSVRGLRLPVEARLGPNGSFALGKGCVDARVAGLSYGSFAIGPARLPLCPVAGGWLVEKPAGGSVAFGAATRNLRLSGRLGNSPMLLTAASARIARDRGFEAAALDLRLGKTEAPVLISADKLAGRLAGTGARGTFTGGEAVIGKVPLKLSNAGGTWSVHNGDLTLDGAMDVDDRADPPRFYTLHSDNVHMTLADDWIRATGLLKHPASGTPITEVEIAHRLSTGNGDATLNVPGIRFGEALQPEELTRLTEGVIALVNGLVKGQGQIHWSGNGAVTSSGDFQLVDTDLAAPFGPVTGINTNVHFSDLLALETAPGQVLTAKTVNPGILVENGTIRYQLLRDNLVRVERGEWPFMGGKLILQETILDFGRPSAKRLTFEVQGLDAHVFVGTMGFSEIDATGIFDGVLPMIFDEQGGRIVGGRLDSREGGGVLEYRGTVSKADLGMFGNLAFDALRNLRYKSMIIRLDGFLDGEFATRLTIDNVALGNTSTANFLRSINRVPFKFNVTIRGPFRALIATAKSFRDPQPVISDVVPLADVPGIVTEVRRREEDTDQTQTPVKDEITRTPPEEQGQ